MLVAESNFLLNVILGIQDFYHAFCSAVGSDWLLGKASIMPKHPGNARFELQVGDVSYRQEDLVYLYGLLF
jgi:hypothetical protein